MMTDRCPQCCLQYQHSPPSHCETKLTGMSSCLVITVIITLIITIIIVIIVIIVTNIIVIIAAGSGRTDWDVPAVWPRRSFVCSTILLLYYSAPSSVHPYP